MFLMIYYIKFHSNKIKFHINLLTYKNPRTPHFTYHSRDFEGETQPKNSPQKKTKQNPKEKEKETQKRTQKPIIKAKKSPKKRN
jgi:hypothetical protein